MEPTVNQKTIFLLVALSILALSALYLQKNPALFDDNFYVTADIAIDSIRVQNAKHFSELRGQPSWQGYSHPGPALYYMNALGEFLFYDVLKLFPTPYAAHLFTYYIFNSTIISLGCLIFFLTTKNVILTGLLHSFSLFFYSLTPLLTTMMWPAFIIGPLYFFYILSTASFGAGNSRFLPAVFFAGSFLVHVYANQILVVGATFVLSLPLFLQANKWSIRNSFNNLKPYLLLSLTVLTVFITPFVLDTVLNWPGNIGIMLDFLQKPNAPRTHSDAISFISHILSGQDLLNLHWFIATLFTLQILTIIFSNKSPQKENPNNSNTYRYFTSIILLLLITLGILYRSAFICKTYFPIHSGYFFYSGVLLFLMITIFYGILGRLNNKATHMISALFSIALLIFVSIWGGFSNPHLTAGHYHNGYDRFIIPKIITEITQLNITKESLVQISYPQREEEPWRIASGLSEILKRKEIPSCIDEAPPRLEHEQNLLNLKFCSYYPQTPNIDINIRNASRCNDGCDINYDQLGVVINQQEATEPQNQFSIK